LCFVIQYRALKNAPFPFDLGSSPYLSRELL
jgi:hypothetical protein